MPIDPDDLPSDVATLRAMLSEQAAEMALQRTELAAARAGLLEQRYEIEALPGPAGPSIAPSRSAARRRSCVISWSSLS